MQDQINAMFRRLAPSIVESWFITAPRQPSDECTVIVPLEGATVTESMRGAVSDALCELFMVREAQFVERATDYFPKPAVVVQCHSWNDMRKRTGLTWESGAA